MDNRDINNYATNVTQVLKWYYKCTKSKSRGSDCRHFGLFLFLYVYKQKIKKEELQNVRFMKVYQNNFSNEMQKESCNGMYIFYK